MTPSIGFNIQTLPSHTYKVQVHLHDGADGTDRAQSGEPWLHARAIELEVLMTRVPYDCGTDAMPPGLMRARWVDQEWMAWISAQMCARKRTMP